MSSTEEEITFVDLLAILLRHKKLIFLTTAAVFVLTLIFLIGSLILSPEKSYLPNVYTPKATVLVSTNNSGGLSSLINSDAAGLASLAGVNLGGEKSNGQLAVVLAKSNSTLDELNGAFDFTARYKVKRNPKTATRKAMLKNLLASYDEKTTILTISFKDWDPAFAQAVVNRTVQILDRRFASLGGNKAADTRDRLEAKIADVNVQINMLQDKVKKFTSKYGVLDVEAMTTEQVTVLARLRSDLIMKDMEIENYQKFSKIDDPVILRLRSERESIQNQLNDIEKGGSILPGQKEIPTLAFEYAGLKRDLMVQEEILKILTQQYEMAKFNSETQDPAFQVLELAEVPDQKSGPARTTIALAATFAGFLLSVLASFLIEAVAKLRQDPETMKKLRGRL
jgi:uncharacterized protein involved in exopolysaccharide biosynthesis